VSFGAVLWSGRTSAPGRRPDLFFLRCRPYLSFRDPRVHLFIDSGRSRVTVFSPPFSCTILFAAFVFSSDSPDSLLVSLRDAAVTPPPFRRGEVAFPFVMRSFLTLVFFRFSFSLGRVSVFQGVRTSLLSGIDDLFSFNGQPFFSISIFSFFSRRFSLPSCRVRNS